MAAKTARPDALTGRFGLAPAPGGLRLVQDLVNTSLAEPGGGARPDLLADLGTARAWLARALGDWSAAAGWPAPVIELDESDLPALRDHRELLRESLRARLRYRLRLVRSVERRHCSWAPLASVRSRLHPRAQLWPSGRNWLCRLSVTSAMAAVSILKL